MSITNRILRVIYGAPLFFIALIATIQGKMSGWNAIAVLVLLFIFYLLARYVCGYRDIVRSKKQLYDYLNEFKTCRFKLYHADEVIPNHIIRALIERGLLPKIAVYKVSAGASGVAPSGLKVFTASAGEPTYVFLRDNPDKLNAIQRFCLYHELGHADWNSRALRLDHCLASIRLVELATLVSFLFFMTEAGMPMVIAIFEISILAALDVGARWKGNHHLLDEANADRFAFWAFYPHGHEKLVQTLSAYRRILVNQHHFSDFEKKYRVSLLDGLVKAVESGDLGSVSTVDFLSNKLLLVYAMATLVIALNLSALPSENLIYALIAANAILMAALIRERNRRADINRTLSSFKFESYE